MGPIHGSAIDIVLQQAVDAGAVPHVAAIAADRDGIVYEGGAGVRVVGESDDPVSTSTQFRIMSMTKMVCTAAALQQVERGELELAAPVDTFYPEFAELPVLEGFDGDTPKRRRHPEATSRRRPPHRQEPDHAHLRVGLLVLERRPGALRAGHRHPQRGARLAGRVQGTAGGRPR
jgi:CubicO group peptidase (beta-lactamase class C family)